MTKISIITINYNNALGLDDTINSVISLNGINDFIEYLVIDGNSTDDSLNVINKYADKINYWVSEVDTGIYNAMNKGILKANGEYLLFMNSGDIIEDQQSFYECLDCLSGGQDIIYCDISIQATNNEKWVKRSPDKLNLEYFFNNSLAHPATFIKRLLFKEYGLYDEKIRIGADWAFFCKCILLEKVTYQHLSKIFSLFRADGISSDLKNAELMYTEKKDFILKYFYPFGRFYCLFFNLKNYIYKQVIYFKKKNKTF